MEEVLLDLRRERQGAEESEEGAALAAREEWHPHAGRYEPGA